MAQSHTTLPQVDSEAELYFGPFRLEQTRRLWRGEQLIEMRPRPLAVLRYLAERAGMTVSGEELLQQLWPDVYVTKTVLRVCVREIRQALEDTLLTPQFIETVGRQGYQFIASLSLTPPVRSAQEVVRRADTVETKPSPLGTKNWQLTTPFVARERELARLQELFEHAQRGEGQMVFLSGEPGIGKTTVVARFLQQLRARGNVRIGRGQCIEHYGPGEAYLPLLEVFG